jgi:thiol:disulfide interchange protein DsbD
MRYLSLFFFIVLTLGLSAQKSPVSWNFSLEPKGNDKATFVAQASIAKGWNIYAVYMSDEGPIPTSFAFDKIDNGSLDGKVIEASTPIKGYDELFEMEVVKFKNEAVFQQSFITKPGFQLSGAVTFMCCDSERCLPPATVSFALKQ